MKHKLSIYFHAAVLREALENKECACAQLISSLLAKGGLIDLDSSTIILEASSIDEVLATRDLLRQHPFCDSWRTRNETTFDFREVQYCRFDVAGEAIDSTLGVQASRPLGEPVCNVCQFRSELPSSTPVTIVRHVSNARPQVFMGINGGRYFNEEAWQLVKPDLDQCVLIEEHIGRTQNKRDDVRLFRALPLAASGEYVDSKVVSNCEACGRPLEVRTVDHDRGSIEGISGVSKLPESPFNVVRAGNWFGKISAYDRMRVTLDWLATHAVYEKWLKLKIVGVVAPSTGIVVASKLERDFFASIW